MKYVLRPAFVLPLIASLVFCACAAPHKVDSRGVDAARNNVFHVGSVKISCQNLKNLPHMPLQDYGKEQQLALLQNIPSEEILQVLAEKYGLRIALGESMVVDSRPVHFTALFSQSMGRCFSLKNDSVSNADNVVDIALTLASRGVPLMPFKITVGYDVRVRSGDSVLIKHEGDVGVFEFPVTEGFPREDAFEKIDSSARNIPKTLRRDIENQKKTATN